MYIGPRPDDERAGLRLARVDHLTFAERGPFDEVDRQWAKDLWELYGFSWDDSYLEGGRVSFLDMVKAMADHLGPLAENLDVAVLANSTTDAETTFALPYLEQAAGGIGTVFGVSDQGSAAPFTSLRLLTSTLSQGSSGRGLVLVMDQTALLAGPPVPPDLRPERDTAVALLLERDGTLGAPDIRQHVTKSAGDVVDRFREAAENTDGQSVIVICRAHVAPYWAKTGVKETEMLVAPEGQPCTALWSTLADYYEQRLPGGDQHILLADYDERLGYVSSCLLNTGGAR
ncbi:MULTISPECIES: hypothetical protein [unclassified Streptomyces]|uniref:hypothetical protein n=1 Tax=unclassified Streptomyces TaxID=2593676 RepID=UPI0036E41EF7